MSDEDPPLPFPATLAPALSLIHGCFANNTCFPLDPCAVDSHCRNGRWRCSDRLIAGTDGDNAFGQCQSNEASVAIFYFSANLMLFLFFVLLIFLRNLIPIICCWRFIPCIQKKNARGGNRGGKGKQAKGKPGKGKGSGGKGGAQVANVARGGDSLDALEPMPWPNVRAMHRAAKLASTLISHDMEDGDGVVLETINSRALAKERADAVRAFRTASLLASVVECDASLRETMEPVIAAGLVFAYASIVEGLKGSTSPPKAKSCLSRAKKLSDEIINAIVNLGLANYANARNWILDGLEHRTLDRYVVVCRDILDAGPPERSCLEICLRKPRKPMPPLPALPRFSTDPSAVAVVASTVPSVANPAFAVSAAKDEENPPEIVTVAIIDEGNKAEADNDADGDKVQPEDSAEAPASNVEDTNEASSDSPSANEAYETSDGDVEASPTKRGLVGMAGDFVGQSTRRFDTSLLSSRKLSMASSQLISSANLGNARSNAQLLDANNGESDAAEGPLGRMMSRLGRTISRLQTERAMVNILASSPPAEMPDLDKLFQHAELCADLSDKHVTVMTLQGRANEQFRDDAVRVYRICGLFCKLFHLDPSALKPEIAQKIAAPLAEAQSLMTDGFKSTTSVDKAATSLQRATDLLHGIIEVLTSPSGPFNNFSGAAAWTQESVEFLALDEYVHDCMLLFEEEPPRTCLQKLWHGSPYILRKLWQAFGIPDSMRNHPLFYFVFLLVWLFLVFRFFIGTCDVAKNVFNSNNDNEALSGEDAQLGSVPAHICLQVDGRTFLGVGPQYTSVLGRGRNVDALVPLMYGVMHSLLFLFGALPVPMARGFWRDVSYWIPIVRRILPVDDHIFLHKFIGYMALMCLFIGAALWTILMGFQECFSGDTHEACTAFDPENIRAWANPIENVVMLRVIIIFTWFFGITWMRYQSDPPKYWFFGLCCLKRLPTGFRQHFFEYAYILHVTIALVSFILAERARFEVFYPVLPTWGLYVVDSFRETLFMTFRCDIRVAKSTVHLDPNDNNRPTTMTVLFDNPWRPSWRGGCIKRHPSQGAGMWVFVKIPSISAIEWHPFSLASADGDDFMELQIGIRPGVSMGWRKPDNWVLDKSTAIAKVTGEGAWVQQEAKTWTYKLYELLLNTPGDARIPCKIRGPYGSSFRLCFSKGVKGALIMGAGTGLSAVESMLRAMLHRKRDGKYTPNHVWVCWQARRVGDLLWMWDALNELLVQAVKDGTIKKSPGWTPANKTLGFLRITFFISRAEAAQLDTLRHLPKHKQDDEQIHAWLTSRNRILQSSISNEGTHITKYIRHIRAELNRLEDARNAKLGISFCGPSAVSKLVADGAAQVGGRIEFSSDATA